MPVMSPFRTGARRRPVAESPERFYEVLPRRHSSPETHRAHQADVLLIPTGRPLPVPFPLPSPAWRWARCP